jgi:hypothetical protein
MRSPALNRACGCIDAPRVCTMHSTPRVYTTHRRTTRVYDAPDATRVYDASTHRRSLAAAALRSTRARGMAQVAYDEACRRSGKRCLRTTNIMDFRGLGLSSFTSFVRDLVMRVSAVNQTNYPEGLEACYIINAPWAFTAIFAFIRPFLAQTTLDKIKVRRAGRGGKCGALRRSR